MAQILYGSPVASAIISAAADGAARLTEKGIIPCLAVIRVGEQESSLAYERSIQRICAKIAAQCVEYALPENASIDEILNIMHRINKDPSIHGCIPLCPMPAGIDEFAVLEALLPEKDLDGLTTGSLGMILAGRGKGFPPCTAEACLDMLDYYGLDISGKNVVVIGRSAVVGKPVSLMLQARDATVTMCHTKTRGLDALCRKADIIITAAGCAGLISPECTNPEQVIIDVGVNMTEGRMTGDAQFDALLPCAAAVSPVPGGVGPVTAAILAKHLVSAAEKYINGSER